MDAVAFVESKARSLHPLRWRFVACAASYGGLLLLFIIAVWLGWQPRFNAVYLFALLSPLLVWSWGLLCWASWFHPERGTMRIGSPWFLRAPRAVQELLRAVYIAGLFVWFLTPLLIAAIFL